MYHEVLSITKSEKLPEEQQKEILKDIALNYIQSRAKNNLVYGVLHHDKKDNLHYHFMISSNELESDKKHRLSKEEFSQFKKDLEIYVLEVYPELEQKKLINKEPGQQRDPGEQTSNKGVELKRRTGKLNEKDSVKERLRTVFAETKTKAEFFTAMEREQLEIYVHGNTIGVLDKITDRKHRLKTLGMRDEFNVISERLEEIENRKAEVDYAKNEFSKERIDLKLTKETSDNYETTKPVDKNMSQDEIKKRRDEIIRSRKGKNNDNDFDKSRWFSPLLVRLKVRWIINTTGSYFSQYIDEINERKKIISKVRHQQEKLKNKLYNINRNYDLKNIYGNENIV